MKYLDYKTFELHVSQLRAGSCQPPSNNRHLKTLFKAPITLNCPSRCSTLSLPGPSPLQWVLNDPVFTVCLDPEQHGVESVSWGRMRPQVAPLLPLRVAGAEARGSKCSTANSIKQGKDLSSGVVTQEPNRNAVWRMDSGSFVYLLSQPFFRCKYTERPPGKGERLVSYPAQVHTGNCMDQRRPINILQ